MYLYVFLYHFLHMSIYSGKSFVIGLELLLLIIAYYHLIKTLLVNPSNSVIILILLLALISSALDINLGRFGIVAYWGLYYLPADALRLLAISFWLRKRFLTAMFFLSAAVSVHPAMGLYALAFIFFAQLADYKKLFTIRVWVAFVIFVLLTSAWLFTHLPENSLTNGAIPNKMWFALTALTNMHWYPVHVGVFSTMFSSPFYTFLSFLLLLLYSLSRYTSNQQIRNMIVSGMLGLGILIMAGIIFSIIKISPFLIKLALQRSSDLILRIGLIYVVAQLWSEFQEGLVWRKGLLFTTLATPCLSLTVPFTFLNSFLVVLPSCMPFFIKQKITIWNKLIICQIGAMLLLSIFYYYKGFGAGIWGGMKLGFFPEVYTGGALVLVIIASSTVIFYIISIIDKSTRLNITSLTAIAAIFVCAVFWTNKHVIYDFGFDVLYAKDYKDTQLWAHNNTNNDALFMVDPHHILWLASILRTPYLWQYERLANELDIHIQQPSLF